MHTVEARVWVVHHRVRRLYWFLTTVTQRSSNRRRALLPTERLREQAVVLGTAQLGDGAHGERVDALCPLGGEHGAVAHAAHEVGALVVGVAAGDPLPVGGPGPDVLKAELAAAHVAGVGEAAEAVLGVDVGGVIVVVLDGRVEGGKGEGAVLQQVDVVVLALAAAVAHLFG